MKLTKEEFEKKKQMQIGEVCNIENLQQDDNADIIAMRKKKKKIIAPKNMVEEEIEKNEEIIQVINDDINKNEKRKVAEEEEEFLKNVQKYLFYFDVDEIRKSNQKISEDEYKKILSILEIFKNNVFSMGKEKINDYQQKLKELKFLYEDEIRYKQYLKEQERKDKDKNNVSSVQSSFLTDESSGGQVQLSSSGQVGKSKLSTGGLVDSSSGGLSKKQVQKIKLSKKVSEVLKEIKNKKLEDKENVSFQNQVQKSNIDYLRERVEKITKKENDDRLRLYLPKKIIEFLKMESLKNGINCMEVLRNYISNTNFSNFKFLEITKEEMFSLGKNEVFSIRLGVYFDEFFSLLKKFVMEDSQKSKFVLSVVYPFYLRSLVNGQ